MALRLNDGRLVGTDSDVAKLTGRSPRTVREWRAKGWLPPVGPGGVDLTAALPTLFLQMAEQAAGRASADEDGLDLITERARLAKEQADGHAMKNAMLRAEMISAEDLEAVGGALVDVLRTNILGLPTKAAPLVVGLSGLAEVRDKLTELVHDLLGNLAATEIVEATKSRARGRAGLAPVSAAEA